MVVSLRVNPSYFSPAGRMSGGGLSLLADLTQGTMVRLWAGGSQQLCCSPLVGHCPTRDAAPEWLDAVAIKRQIVHNASYSALRYRLGPAALVIIYNGLRCGFAHFKLCAHFLEGRIKR